MKIHQTLALAIAVMIGGTAVSYAPPAAAQWAVFDPTNYVQNYMTQLRAVQSNLNELRQIQQQLESLQYAAENTKALTQGDWDTGADSIGRLINVMESGQSIAVSGKDFEGRFKQLFPGYKPNQDYAKQYDRWNQSTTDSVYGAMRAANMQLEGIGSETQALNSLRMAAKSTTGQKQALDAANQIAMAQIDQMQQLRELVAAQTQIAGSQAAAAAAAEQAKRNQAADMLRYKGMAPPTGRKACAAPPCV